MVDENKRLSSLSGGKPAKKSSSVRGLFGRRVTISDLQKSLKGLGSLLALRVGSALLQSLVIDRRFSAYSGGKKNLNPNAIKGPWTPEEDAKVVKLVTEMGAKKWSLIASHLPGRIGKQCNAGTITLIPIL